MTGLRGVGVLLVTLVVWTQALGAEKLPIQVFVAADGLDQTVTCALEDTRGFLWFCTSVGFVLFDGHDFTRFGPEHGLPRAAVNDALEWQEQVFWLGTGSGAVRLDLRPRTSPTSAEGPEPRVKVVKPGPSRQSLIVRTLHRDRAGRLWAGTSDGLYVLERADTSDQHFRRVPLGLQDDQSPWELIGALEDASDGGLWVGTDRALLRVLPDEGIVRYTHRPPVGRQGVGGLHVDRQGRLWVGTEAMLALLDREPDPPVAGSEGHEITLGPNRVRYVSVADGIPDPRVTGFLETTGGDLLIGTVGGLCRPSGPRFTCYTRAAGLSDYEVWALTEDRSGNVWLGSKSGGAMRLASAGMSSFFVADGLGADQVKAILPGPQGAMRVVTEERGASGSSTASTAPASPR